MAINYNRRNWIYICFGCLTCSLLLLWITIKTSPIYCDPLPENTNKAGIMISGVTGTTFSGQPYRKYQERRLFYKYSPKTHVPLKVTSRCIHWIVFTSIHTPSDSVGMFKKVTEKYDNWCCVVVMDKNTPFTDYLAIETDKFVVLTIQKQFDLSKSNGFSLIELIPYNHFGRKNIGFLYAISKGAQIIYDSDDDNLLKENVIPFIKPEEEYQLVSSEDHILNPYKFYKSNIPHSFWPRGMPLDSIMHFGGRFVDMKNVKCKPSNPKDITLYQLLADHDPDVDAIYRLTNPLPVYFNSSFDKPLVLQIGMFS